MQYGAYSAIINKIVAVCPENMPKGAGKKGQLHCEKNVSGYPAAGSKTTECTADGASSGAMLVSVLCGRDSAAFLQKRKLGDNRPVCGAVSAVHQGV